MSSSTLRRLAKDHKSLHADLPPNFLFPPSSAPDSVPDDLTRLIILLAGPQGTPYSKGVWKLQIKIPDDYPRSPPKAAFRTRIWHPNVEESTGSVCVETLKRDWDPKLTLRDVLITISCLLIQPNPDSALNSAAGQLLQEDYEAYARQAKLMTSIHATVPADLREAVMEAKKRGEDAGTELREDEEQQSKSTRHASSSSVVMKTRPTLTPRTLISSDSSPSSETARPTPHHLTLHPLPTTTPSNPPNTEEDPDPNDDEESSAHKENDPSISPSLVTPTPPRKPQPILGKRPLSDLPTPPDPEDSSSSDHPPASSSSQNIANNTPPSTFATHSPPRRFSPKLVERSKSLNATRDSSTSSSTDTPFITPFEDPLSQSNSQSNSNSNSHAHSLSHSHNDDDDDHEGPAPKRVCSGEGKENFAVAAAAAVAAAVGGEKADKSAAVVPKAAGVVGATAVVKAGAGAGRQVCGAGKGGVSDGSGNRSGSGSGSGRGGKGRVGLRRL